MTITNVKIDPVEFNLVQLEKLTTIPIGTVVNDIKGEIINNSGQW